MKKKLSALFFVLCFAPGTVFAHPNNDLRLAAINRDALALRVALRSGANVNHLPPCWILFNTEGRLLSLNTLLQAQGQSNPGTWREEMPWTILTGLTATIPDCAICFRGREPPPVESGGNGKGMAGYAL